MAKKDGAPKKAASRATAASTEIAVRPSARPAPAPDGAASVADAVLLPVRVARRVLPESRTPMVLGVAALTLLGVLELPAALGVGLAWEALRRWGPE